MNDHELFEAWRAGDAAAGNQLFDRHFDSLFRFFRNKLAHSAEDLVQATFLACVRNQQGFRGDASFRSYLFTIARSKLIDHLRRQQRRGDEASISAMSLMDMGAGPSTMVAEREEERLVQRALSQLPLDLQIAIELFYYESLPAREVAKVLEIPEGTVRSRVRRALDQLRREVERMSPNEPLAKSTLKQIDRLVEAR